MPQSAWSAKDERQYEHVKESEEERGSPRAKEIAARTVNKHRREEGRTEAQRSENREKTRDELYEEAKRLEVDGRSKMNKDELARAVAKASARAK